MVARSPVRGCVIRTAAEDGPSGSGASGSTISNSSPMTKRAASILPSRYFAARSGRAGVRRGSSIAFAQQFVDRARGLAFAALRAPRLRRWRPAVDIDMQPAFRVLDKALQEQRAGDRAGERAGRRVVDVGDFRIEPAIVRWPQRQSPQRIVLLFRQARAIPRQRPTTPVKAPTTRSQPPHA